MLKTLREELGDCQRCSLCSSRKNIVFGSGPDNTPLVILGESPGNDEDILGVPFVGRSGKLLDKWISEQHWDRKYIRIINTILCRPPNNRPPTEEELNTCKPFSLGQLEIIKPRVVITLGKTAAQVLLNSKEPLGRLINRTHKQENYTVYPTYHPSYILRGQKEAEKHVLETFNKVNEFFTKETFNG
jgi:uracil-DNA glycosylase family 4